MYSTYAYGMATVSRIDQSIGLFCRISSLLKGSFRKETYNFIDPTNRSHNICIFRINSVSCAHILFLHIVYVQMNSMMTKGLQQMWMNSHMCLCFPHMCMYRIDSDVQLIMSSQVRSYCIRYTCVYILHICTHFPHICMYSISSEVCVLYFLRCIFVVFPHVCMYSKPFNLESSNKPGAETDMLCIECPQMHVYYIYSKKRLLYFLYMCMYSKPFNLYSSRIFLIFVCILFPQKCVFCISSDAYLLYSLTCVCTRNPSICTHQRKRAPK